MRIALAVLLAIHGFINLLGFLKVWKLAEVPRLTGATLFALPEPLPRVVGLIWLGACLVFIGAASSRVGRCGYLRTRTRWRPQHSSTFECSSPSSSGASVCR